MPWPTLPPLDQPTLSAMSDEADALAKSLPEFLAKVYRYTRALIGEDEAKELWANTMPKKGRGKHGPWKDYDDIDRDGFLLREYDLWCKAATPKHAKRVPRMLGKILHRAAPGRFGGNADTIARRIRHLRDERRKRRPAVPVSTILSPFPHGN